MKQLFTLEITETLCRRVSIEANNIEEAIKKLEEKYEKAEIILDADDFEDYSIKEVK